MIHNIVVWKVFFDDLLSRHDRISGLQTAIDCKLHDIFRFSVFKNPELTMDLEIICKNGDDYFFKPVSIGGRLQVMAKKNGLKNIKKH